MQLLRGCGYCPGGGRRSGHYRSRLEQFRASSKRMERLASPLGLEILNDSYNANPASMASGLRTLGGMAAQSRWRFSEICLNSARRETTCTERSVMWRHNRICRFWPWSESLPNRSDREPGFGHGSGPNQVVEDKNEMVDWITVRSEVQTYKPTTGCWSKLHGGWHLIRLSTRLWINVETLRP